MLCIFTQCVSYILLFNYLMHFPLISWTSWPLTLKFWQEFPQFLLTYFQRDATLHSLFLENCSTRFGWYVHPSSGAHTTVFTVSGTCQTVTATCRCCGRVGLTQPHQNRPVQFPHHTQTSSNSSTTAAGSSNGLTSTRYCKYSFVCSWWWVELPPETCRAVFQK